jgi:methionine-S-sulfoxide reductase
LACLLAFLIPFSVVCHISSDAETIRVSFDPSVISYNDILEMMFAFHTPADPRWAGTQYRSAIFAHNPEQRELAEKALQKVGGKLATYVAIEDSSDFYKAEEYHQKYLEKALTM